MENCSSSPYGISYLPEVIHIKLVIAGLQHVDSTQFLNQVCYGFIDSQSITSFCQLVKAIHAKIKIKKIKSS